MIHLNQTPIQLNSSFHNHHSKKIIQQKQKLIDKNKTMLSISQEPNHQTVHMQVQSHNTTYKKFQARRKTKQAQNYNGKEGNKTHNNH